MWREGASMTFLKLNSWYSPPNLLYLQWSPLQIMAIAYFLLLGQNLYHELFSLPLLLPSGGQSPSFPSLTSIIAAQSQLSSQLTFLLLQFLFKPDPEWLNWDINQILPASLRTSQWHSIPPGVKTKVYLRAYEVLMRIATPYPASNMFPLWSHFLPSSHYPEPVTRATLLSLGCGPVLGLHTSCYFCL